MVLVLLRHVHRWIGLVIAVPVALLGATGAVLALADLVPDQRATLAPPQSVGAIVMAAQAWGGVGSRASRYIAPQESGTVARVEIATDGKPSRSVRIDPATLAVLGGGPSGGGALGWIHSLHVQFLAAAYGGRSFGGWCGIGMLAMLLTAMPIWWPREGRAKQAFTADFRAKGVVFHRRLHGAAGAWVIGVLMVLTVTGIAMAFPRTTRGMLGLEQREAPRGASAKDAPAMSASDIDRAVALGHQAVSGTALRMMFLPPRAADATRLVFYQAGQSGAVNAIQVQVDMAAGRVRAVDDPAARPAADGLYRWLHDLHTGSGIGDWWRVLGGIAGGALPLLSVTGVLMWWRKRVKRRQDMDRQPVRVRCADTGRPNVPAGLNETDLLQREP